MYEYENIYDICNLEINCNHFIIYSFNKNSIEKYFNTLQSIVLDCSPQQITLRPIKNYNISF